MASPVWTALQSNKEGTKTGVVDETNLAESYAQAAEADFILGLFQKSGFGTLHVAKNRMGVKDRTFNISMDTAKSTVVVLEESEGVENTSKDLIAKQATNNNKKSELKNFLKDKQKQIKEMNNDIKDVFNE